ncbi:hypothetical protein CFC21_101461 [Triticum aestivum]|uniref:F-box domain-containing protein n=3 Tax=Triticum TaxID=4564 RepID=A0A9R1BWG9_TRITD|nr:uncharacterized protein LOC123162707 isoform X2 [Triticum aestivum]KAF7099874.1 hypothetical protein CFC21_101461 [Triticum aestivum]VAI83579.1 unnamed protein product [Triticum turgidum subsp. durum]
MESSGNISKTEDRIDPTEGGDSIVASKDEDRISALPSEILLHILERLDLRTAIRAGTVATRWRHLPHQLSHLLISTSDVCKAGYTTDEIMKAYTDATRRLLSPPTCKCTQTIKTLKLGCYIMDPYLSTIGHTVQDVVKSREPEYLEFAMCPDVASPSDAQLALYGQRFMSFFGAYPGPFKLLTRLILQNLAFQDSDVTNLLNTCSKLKMLSLRSCEMPQESVLELDAPSSELSSLELKCFGCIHVELICLPKLRELVYDVWFCENPPVSFGYVPQLHHVCFACPAQSWQKPFVLSQCLSSDINLSNLLLNFYTQMIWVEPEGPQQLTPIFSKLRDVHLCGIFTECDLDWTMFILEGAPSLENFHLSRHSCEFNKSEDDAEKTNLVRQASNFKHLKLKLFVMKGFEEEYKVMNYIRLVMERAVCLKRIELPAISPCKKCTAISPRFPVDEASKHRIREQLRYGLSSSTDIIIG